jgi:hypothetical protein
VNTARWSSPVVTCSKDSHPYIEQIGTLGLSQLKKITIHGCVDHHTRTRWFTITDLKARSYSSKPAKRTQTSKADEVGAVLLSPKPLDNSDCVGKYGVSSTSQQEPWKIAHPLCPPIFWQFWTPYSFQGSSSIVGVLKRMQLAALYSISDASCKPSVVYLVGALFV